MKQKAATIANTAANAVSPTSSAAAVSVAPAAAASNATIPIATTELYPYDTFIKLWKSSSLANKLPCGIFNLGNTCYINAILQVLLATRPLAAYLLTKEHTCPSPAANLYGNTKNEWCPLCCLVSLAQDVFGKSPTGGAAGGSSSTGGQFARDPLSIRNFVHYVHQLNSSFTFGDQHDAQELYVALLDAIECVSLRENEAKINDGAAVIKNIDQFSKQTTLMNHVFTCYTRTQVECTSCGKVSKSYASDTGIMLSVPEENKLKNSTAAGVAGAGAAAYTLENLLENFTCTEVLEGDDAYRCDACNARVKAHKSNVIEIAPNILAIQLSRVGMNFFSTGGEFAQKNSAAVEFPLELDLTPFMAADALDAAPAVYELYGVVTHEGSTTEDGHYIAAVRYGGGRGRTSTQEGQWFVCDDDVVSPLNVDIVLKQQEEAYLLFYERKQPRVPQLLQSVGVGGEAKAEANGEVLSSLDVSETREKCTSTPEVVEEVKPRAANGPQEEEEGGGAAEDDDALSYVFEMENGGDSGGRLLRFKARLPSVEADSTEEPQIELRPGTPVFAEGSCGGCSLLRMPLPVQVALPARKIMWSGDAKMLDVLFDAL